MTPIERNIDRLQNEGRGIYVYGWTEDKRYALIVDADNDRCSIAPKGTANGLGRWECDGRPDEYLAARFPILPGGIVTTRTVVVR